MPIRKLTILHSNDMHGDFLPEVKDGKETGGIVRLSGYIKKAREEEEGVLYVNAGDMFRGSVIDSEYQGFSTIELMNFLAPDIVTLGNHEVDYGLTHLLFLEKCAKFPIINANMYITTNHARLFNPYKIIEINGLNVLFVGIITSEVLSTTRGEGLVGTFVDVWEARDQIGVIIDNYKTTKIDLTVLVTHIGYKEDRLLASLLDPNWGVDIIIGAHSHTLLEKPKVVNGIPIVQVGHGTGKLGRFDIEIDTDEHKMVSCDWSLIPINSDTAPKDEVIEMMLNAFKSETDEKYSRILTTFKKELTHPSRALETELGDLFADLMQVDSSFDIMLYGSGSIRKKTLGPIVEYQDLKECLPFINQIYMLTVTGKQFREMCHFYLKNSVVTNGSSEFYQVSRGVKLVYDVKSDTLETCSYEGKEVTDDQRLKIALQEFHYNNFSEFLGVPIEEVVKNGKPRLVVTNDFSIYEELLVNSQGIDYEVEGRIIIRK